MRAVVCSKFGLPEDVVFCSKCVMSNQRPRIVVEFKNSSNQKSGINKNYGWLKSGKFSK